MSYTILSINGPIQTSMAISGSRSITYRALLLTALANGVSEISRMAITPPILAFINALSQLGIVTQFDETSRSCIIAGGNGTFPKKQTTIWCDDLSIITHFLIAACSASSGVYYFDGGVQQRKKSLKTLSNCLRLQGMQCIPNDADCLPFSLIGADSLEGGEILLNKKMKNHLIAALFMIAPLAKSPFTFTLEEDTDQTGINMITSMMADFGVLVHRVHQNQFMVPVPQQYQAKDYVIEPDMGLAAYLFAAAAITGGEITIQGLKRNSSKQSQIKFLSLLEKIGCKIIETETRITVKAAQTLNGIEVNMPHFNEIFFALCAIAPFAKSPTKIFHRNSLNKKEANDLMLMKNELIKLDIRVETGENWIKIYPSQPHGHTLISSDHPGLAMTFAVIGLRIPHITLDEQSILNQYPDFLNIWHQLTTTVDITT